MNNHRIRQVQFAYWACLGWVAAGFFCTVVFGGVGDGDFTVLGAAVGVAFIWSSWLDDFAVVVVVPPPAATGVAFAWRSWLEDFALVAAAAALTLALLSSSTDEAAGTFPLGLLGSCFVALKMTLSKISKLHYTLCRRIVQEEGFKNLSRRRC